jgi:hypothetical protein
MQEFDDREADGIRTSRRARREHAVRTVVAGRRADQVKAFDAIEYPENDQVGETVDVSQSLLEFGQDLQRSFCLVLRAEAFGDFLGFFVGAPDKSDWSWGEHERIISKFAVFDQPI